MGLWYEIPANQLGGLKLPWVFAGYGFSQVWVRTGSTVIEFNSASRYTCAKILISANVTSTIFQKISPSTTAIRGFFFFFFFRNFGSIFF